MTETASTIQVNECYGPTVQGEGPLIGRPCFFIRLHNCPVKCPGCDTAFTWNGSEKGVSLPLVAEPDSSPAKALTENALETWLENTFTSYPHCGLVLSGGEPLLHYKNEEFRLLLKLCGAPWMALETSGYVGKIPSTARSARDYPNLDLVAFLNIFKSISLSPKTTPCLHGELSREQLLCNVAAIMTTLEDDWADTNKRKRLFIKMVARDQADIDEIVRCNEEYNWQNKNLDVYVMPFGQQRDEVLKACEFLVPQCAKYGFILTPRLHSLIWGKERLR